MASINQYADRLLLDFADAAHAEVQRVLRQHHGPDWLAKGVRKHFPPEQFRRVETMLANPMRVVEMNKTTADIHGLEHFWNIIDGNWPLFRASFGDKARTNVFFGEIAELRHNLAHRRGHHTLLRSNLIRILDNCRLILSALDSPKAAQFTEVVDSLSSGGSPWGLPLDGRLPPSDAIYADFVGRPTELNTLSEWLSSDSPQILVWGYGGAGKSALAHRFAREVRDGSNDNLIAACWVSAKKMEYVEGAVRERPVDFTNKKSFVHALWSALYDSDASPDDSDASTLLNHLGQMPILLIVDDFDTVSDDETLTQFLLHDLRNTSTRVIYTSRHRVPGIRNLEVPPFSGPELQRFVALRSIEYRAMKEDCLKRVNGIQSVTGGYPLFVDDLIHHAALVGIDDALKLWSQKKGDAAREYALRRQVEYLGPGCGDVLIALSVANRALILQEISNIAGLTDDDSEASLRELLRWRMVNHVTGEGGSSPGYRMNDNTRRLVAQTFKDDNRLKACAVAFKTLTGERVPEAKRRAIGRIISDTTRMEFNEGFETALQYLKENMVGELGESPDLYGVLGRLYSRQPSEECRKEARAAFTQSHQLGASKTDTYYHWVIMEKNVAESIGGWSSVPLVGNEGIAEQWRECERVAEMGISRCGTSQLLCYWAGYAAARGARALEHEQSFVQAQSGYARGKEWFQQALMAPVSDADPVARRGIYRGMALALEGLGEVTELHRTLEKWGEYSPGDSTLAREYRRLAQKYPQLHNDSRLRELAT